MELPMAALHPVLSPEINLTSITGSSNSSTAIHHEESSLETSSHSCHFSTELRPKTRLLIQDPVHGKNHYVATAIRYFLSMKSNQNPHQKIAMDSNLTVDDFLRPVNPGEWNSMNKFFAKQTIQPELAENVVRFEFPPWLLTTGFGPITMKNSNEICRLIDTEYQSMDCRFFETQPFCRAHVVFLYGGRDVFGNVKEPMKCRIYQEFTFNDKGELSFIEAWSDIDGYRPMESRDTWAKEGDVKRLSTAIPGLGSKDGIFNPKSEHMASAADHFDSNFHAEYWPQEYYSIGPFQTLLNDVQGKVSEKRFPGSRFLSFWPAWVKRVVEHDFKFPS